MLALLALIFLVRCAIDPWNHEYHHLPFLAALACWEVVRGRAPVLAGASAAVLWLVFSGLAEGSGRSDAADVVYVVWAAVAVAGLCAALWRLPRVSVTTRARARQV